MLFPKFHLRSNYHMLLWFSPIILSPKLLSSYSFQRQICCHEKTVVACSLYFRFETISLNHPVEDLIILCLNILMNFYKTTFILKFYSKVLDSKIQNTQCHLFYIQIFLSNILFDLYNIFYLVFFSNLSLIIITIIKQI